MKYLTIAAFIALTAFGGTALAEGKTHYDGVCSG